MTDWAERLPEGKKTVLGLYVTAKGACEQWRAAPDKVKILDVRTPEELLFVGHPTMAWKVPLATQSYVWDAGKGARQSFQEAHARQLGKIVQNHADEDVPAPLAPDHDGQEEIVRLLAHAPCRLFAEARRDQDVLAIRIDAHPDAARVGGSDHLFLVAHDGDLAHAAALQPLDVVLQARLAGSPLRGQLLDADLDGRAQIRRVPLDLRDQLPLGTPVQIEQRRQHQEQQTEHHQQEFAAQTQFPMAPERRANALLMDGRLAKEPAESKAGNRNPTSGRRRARPTQRWGDRRARRLRGFARDCLIGHELARPRELAGFSDGGSERGAHLRLQDGTICAGHAGGFPHVGFFHRRKRDDPLSIRLFASVFNRLFRLLVFPQFPKGGFDLVLLDRVVVDAILAMPEKNSYLFDQVLWVGFRRATIPYDRAAGRRAVVKVVTPGLHKGKPVAALLQPKKRGSGRQQ